MHVEVKCHENNCFHFFHLNLITSNFNMLFMRMTHGPHTTKLATLCIHGHSLCVSGVLCMRKNVRGARRMNVQARRTPDKRRLRWTNARHMRSTRWIFVVCSSSNEHLAHTYAHLAHTWRASNACPALLARAIRSAR